MEDLGDFNDNTPQACLLWIRASYNEKNVQKLWNTCELCDVEGEYTKVSPHTLIDFLKFLKIFFFKILKFFRKCLTVTGESKEVNITYEINNFQDELLSCWDVPFSLVSCSCSLMQTWIKMDSSARPPSSSSLMLQKLCQEFKNMLLQTLNCTKLKLRMHQGKTMFDSMDLKSTGITNDEWFKFTRVFCL